MTTKLNPILLFVIIVASLYNCQGKDQNTSHGNHPCSNYSIEQNKKIVIDFYQQMFGDKDISAVDKYIAPDYIQHNPNVADGAEAFKKAAAKWFEGKPKTKVDIQHIAAEGDLVFIHIKNIRPDGGLKSTIDIFRLKDGKIVEHWDVHEDVPQQSANSHPMF